MADPKSDDPHYNNGGYTIDPQEQAYDSWDWRKIQVAIIGSVNSDKITTESKQPGTSNPHTFWGSADHFETAHTALSRVHLNLKTATDNLVGIDNPTWTGDAATAFKGLMTKTMAAVKGHLEPLEGPPSYADTLRQSGDALYNAINTVYQQNYAAATEVINRYNKESPVKGPRAIQFRNPPWYEYHGGTIVIVSHYPDIDQKLTKDMQTTLRTLVQEYKSSATNMPAPSGTLPITPPDPPDPPKAPTINFPKPQKQPKPPDPPKPPDSPAPPDPPVAPDNLTTDPPIAPDNLTTDPNGNPVLGPNGEQIGPDGKPVLGPNGEQIGPDGKPVLGPNGELLGPDGNPLRGPNGELLGPDGKPLADTTNPNTSNVVTPDSSGLTQPTLVNTPNGPALVGPDGNTLLDPKTKKPLKGPDGKPLTLDNLAKNSQVPPIISPLSPGGNNPPIIRNVPAVKQPSLPKINDIRPPNMNNLIAGGPAKPSSLQSEGVKPGSQEFGEPARSVSGNPGGKQGSGQPMPMGGGGGAGGGGGGKEDRDRTTWLVEDEEIWGAETTVSLGVLGR